MNTYEQWHDWLENVVRPIDRARAYAVANRNQFNDNILQYRPELFDVTTLNQVRN